MFYLRMVCQRPRDIYLVLEPLYADYRRVNYRDTSGQFRQMHIDEIVDHLLRDDRFCEVMLPRMQKRYVLEQNGLLSGPRVSPLEEQVKEKDDAEDKASGAAIKDEQEYAFEKQESDDGESSGRRRRKVSRSRSRSLSSSGSGSSSDRSSKSDARSRGLG